MGLELLEIVHVGLPILHNPVVLGGDHPVVVVRPLHGSNGTLVRLNGA